MKRAFLQEPTASSFEQFRCQGGEYIDAQAGSVGSRRVQTSVAMLGLALSFGAAGGILSKSESVLAAEGSVPSVLPMAQASAESALPLISVASSDSQSAVYHVVHEGESLWTIAKSHDVDVQLIKSANSIPADQVLKVGQVLRLPVTSHASTSSPGKTGIFFQSSVAPAMARGGMGGEFDAATLDLGSDPELQEGTPSIVLPGQNSLAEKTHALPDQADSTSHSLPSTLPLGSVDAGHPNPELQSNQPWRTNTAALEATIPSRDAEVVTDSSSLPSVVTGSQPAAATQGKDLQIAALGNSLHNPEAIPDHPVDTGLLPVRPYQVKPGDTFWGIASRYGFPSEQLLQYNPNIQDPDAIKVGSIVNVPIAAVEQSESTATNAGEVTTLASAGDLTESQAISTDEAASSRSGITADGMARLQAAAQTPIDQEVLYQRIRAARQASEQASAPVPTSVSVAASGGEATPVLATAATQLSKVQNDQAVVDTTALDQSEPAADVATSDAYTSDLIAEVRSLQRQRWNINDVSRSVDTATTAEQGESQPVALTNPASQVIGSVGGAATDSSVITNPVPDNMLAAAPVGVSSYLPAPDLPVGQTVSPSMPILPGSDQFLPEAPNRFNGYIWPAHGVLTSGFGWRWGRMHKGVDIAGPVGTPVVAAASGVVITAGWNSGGYGNMVDIRHADGSTTRYAHNSRLLVHEGQNVNQGQQIAEMGSTGYSTGPHLHFEVHLPNGGAVNPMAYLPGR